MKNGHDSPTIQQRRRDQEQNRTDQVQPELTRAREIQIKDLNANMSLAAIVRGSEHPDAREHIH